LLLEQCPSASTLFLYPSASGHLVVPYILLALPYLGFLSWHLTVPCHPCIWLTLLLLPWQHQPYPLAVGAWLDAPKLGVRNLTAAAAAPRLDIWENIAVLGSLAVGMRLLGLVLLLGVARLRML
jgi:hypothetical protein